MTELSTAIYYRYLWKYDLTKSVEKKSPVANDQKVPVATTQVEEKKGTALTSAGPAPYAGDILDDPELLWTEDVWDEGRVEDAKQKLSQQGDVVSTYWKTQYETKAGSFWHKFYKRNADHFYKDRHYLHVVFPELLTGAESVVPKSTYLLEVGCGVGNAVIPLIDLNPNLHVVAMDFAQSAIQILNKHPYTHSCIDHLPSKCLSAADVTDDYQNHPPLGTAQVTTNLSKGDHHVGEGENTTQAGQMSAQDTTNSPENNRKNRRIRTAVRDIVRDPLPVPAVSMDLALCMFVLSAIAPAEQLVALRKIAEALKPGGKLLVRDYGRLGAALTAVLSLL